MANQETVNTEALTLTADERRLAEDINKLINETLQGTLAMLADPGLQLAKPAIVDYSTSDQLKAALPATSVMAVFQFQNTLQGKAAFIIDTPSAIKLANILIGSGTDDTATEISDIQIGAVSEAVSQMNSSLSSVLSQFLNNPVELTSPEVTVLTSEKLMETMPDLQSGASVGVNYTFTGGQALPSISILQLSSLQVMKQQMKIVGGALQSDPLLKHSDDTISDSTPKEQGVGQEADSNMAANASGTMKMGNPVTVQPVAFPSFDSYASASGVTNQNLELVMDVCLNLTVELGRTERPIKEILELTRGSVIELEKVAGEPVDLYANGKMIAKGEVVVIEDNFGLRITSIVSPAERIRGL